MGVFRGSNPTLVVDGTITDQLGPHVIKIAMSGEFNSKVDEESVENAVLVIRDNLGNKIPLSHLNPNANFETKIIYTAGGLSTQTGPNNRYTAGIYYTPQDFAGIPGRSYQLSVTLNDGSEYESEFEQPTASPEIDSIYYYMDQYEVLSKNDVIIEEERLAIAIDFCDPEGQENYYRWRYLETFKIVAPWAFFPGRSPGTSCENLVPTRDCWATGFDLDFLKFENDQLFDGSEVKDFQVFSTEFSQKFSEMYSIEIQQNSLSKEAYEFWNKIKTQQENNSTIFESPNYQIRGNMSKVDDPDALVLGYFSANGVSSKRLFMYPSEIDVLYNYEYQCDTNTDSDCARHVCLDCTKYSRSSVGIRPEFWPDDAE